MADNKIREEVKALSDRFTVQIFNDANRKYALIHDVYMDGFSKKRPC